MAESVNLGRAHVEFTGDFGSLMDGIRHAVKVSVEATATIKLALSETDKQVERSNRNIIRSYAEMNRQVRSHLRKITSELVFLQLDIGHIANQFQRMSIMVSAAMAGATAASISFEDAFANVRKTVDASDAEFRALERNLRQMSLETRAGANELAVIMGVAGQLGIRGVENLTNFTRTIDQLTVATTLTGEEGAKNLARLMNIMQESMGNVDRLGAAIVDLGNNFASTETEILNMSLRIAGAGKTIGLTTPEVLALATALSDVGIRAEMGGSAISRVMINMANAVAQGGSRLREFARVANVSAQEFARIFREDPIQAIEMFIRGLERLDRQGQNVFAVLESIGASEIRVRDTLLRLFQAADRLSDAVRRSNRAWEENIALTEEFRKRNETAASQLRIAYNNIVDVVRIVGDEYNPIVKQAAQFTTNLAQAFQAMTPEQRAAVAEFGVLATAILGGISVSLLATKAFITLGTGIVLLARAVAALLSPWGLATIAIVTAAVVIAREWGEIVQMIEQTDLAQSARELWDKFKAEWETMTLPEKTLGVVTVAATVAWSLSFARSFASALAAQYATTYGADKLIPRSGTFLFQLGVVTAAGALLWDLVPENLQTKVDEFWNEVAQAIRDFNAKTIENPLVDKLADWLEGLSGEDWQTGALTVGVSFAAFRAIQAGSVIAARLGVAVASAIAGVAVPVAVAGGILVALGLITMDDDEKNRVKQEIQAIWENEELSITVKVAKILLNVTDAALRSLVEELDDKIYRPIGEIIGTRPSKEGQELQRILLMDPEERREEVRKLRESIGPTRLEAPPTTWERILNILGMGPKPPENTQQMYEEIIGLRQTVTEIDEATLDLLARLAQAEAGVDGFEGMLAVAAVVLNRVASEEFPNSIRDVIYQTNQFEAVLRGTVDEMEASAEALRAVREALAGADPTGGALYFRNPDIATSSWFELRVQSGELIPVKRIGGHEFYVPGYREGVILPGFGGGDRIPALLEAGEAVVPARVVRGGIGDIVAWFRRMGVRKLRGGDPSVGSTAAAIMAASSPQEAISLAETMQAEVSQEMTQFANTLLTGIEQITQSMSVFVFGAAQMIVDVLKALFPDHAETLQKGLDDLRAWWERSFAPKTEEAVASGTQEAAEEVGAAPAEPSATLILPEGLRRLLDITDEIARQARIAAVTGEEFDALGTETRLVRQAIKEMADEMGRIPEEAQPLIERLRELEKQSESLAVKQAAWSSALDTLQSRLSEIDPALGGLARAIKLDPVTGMFQGFDMATLAAQGVAFALNTLIDVFDTGASQMEATVARIRSLDVGTDVLAIAETYRNFQEVDKNRRAAIAEAERLRQLQQQIDTATAVGAVGGAAVGAAIGTSILPGVGTLVGALIGGLSGGSAARAHAKRNYADEIAEAEEEIRRLEGLIENARVKLIDALGIAADNFANSISSAFREANPDQFAERLGQSVRDQIRQAMVQVFIVDVLEPQITELAKIVQDAFLEGAPLDMEAINEQISSIAEVSKKLYEQFDELGLTVEETTKAMRGMSYNIPRIFRINLERFRVADYTNLPSLSNEGYITRSGLAMVHKGEIVARAERFTGGDINVAVHIHGDGWDSDRLRMTIRREVSNAVRDSLSARYGIAGVGV